MCIYNIYIYTFIYVYTYTYKYRGYNMRSSRGPISMNKQVLPNAVTFWLHTVRPMSEAQKVAQLVHWFAHFRWVNVRKFMWTKINVSICPDEINTIRYNLSYLVSGCIAVVIGFMFLCSQSSNPKRNCNRIKTHLSVASNLTSPATGAGNTRRGQTLMLDIEEPPLGSAKKVQRGQNLLRSMFYLAHLGCTVFSVVLAFNVFSCCIYIYIYMIDCDCTGDIWLWPNMRVYISTQNVCFVGIFSTEEVDEVHQNCHRREGVEGIAPCLGNYLRSICSHPLDAFVSKSHQIITKFSPQKDLHIQ